jgi:DNA repair photolyase
MNDPYMPIERKLERTRGAMKIIAEAGYPAHVITKSDLAMRDTDILQDISRTYAAVSFTITTADDDLAKKIEPHAPAPSRRFEAMKHMANSGIYTGVTLMPLLPFINDSRENITSILQRAKDSGASYVLSMMGVTLRAGSREYFYEALDKQFPGIKEKYIRTYGNRYECFSRDCRELDKIYREESGKLGLSTKIEFYNPRSEILSLFDD